MKRRYVVALLAVVASVAIASPVLGGPSLSSLVEKEVAKQLAASGTVSAKGKRGPRGRTGPAGAPGAPGAAGSPAAGAVVGRIENLSNVSNLTQFAAVTGISTATIDSSDVVMASPNTTIVISNFRIEVGAFPGPMATRTITLLDDGSSTTISCQIGPTSLSCTDPDSATISPGSHLLLRAANGATAPQSTADAYFGYTATLP